MKALRLCTDGVGNSKLESLLLPFSAYGATATDDDRARMPAPEVVREYVGVRGLRRADGSVEAAADARHLLVVASGSIDVAATDMSATLSPGDVLLVDDLSSTGHTLTYRGDSRLVRIDVADSWTPHGVVPPAIDDGQRDATTAGKVTELFVTDGQASFRPLDGLFTGEPGDSAIKPTLAVSFTSLSPGSFGDWHTEKASSLVLVLAGGFELEVGGGGGQVEVFRAGDVCLVQNRWGQGHITRTHGETRFAAVVVADEHLWVAPSLQPES